MPQNSTIKQIKKESVPQIKLLERLGVLKAVLVFYLVVISLGTAWGAPFFSPPPTVLSLSFHNQQFSVHIIRAPLRKILATLALYGSLQFIIKGNAKDDLISASFTNLSLTQSLETFLLGYDYAILQRRIDPTRQTSEFRFFLEVVVLSRNSAAPSSDSKEPSFISSGRTSVQPALWQAPQIVEKHNQAKPFDLVAENGSSDDQSIEEGVLQDLDPEVRTLVKQLMQE